MSQGFESGVGSQISLGLESESELLWDWSRESEFLRGWSRSKSRISKWSEFEMKIFSLLGVPVNFAVCFMTFCHLPSASSL